MSHILHDTVTAHTLDCQIVSTPRMLIIDDQEVVTRSIEAAFREAGFQVLTAREGRAGQALALSEKVDLILLEMDLPDMAGTELCRMLKGEAKTKPVPLIVITSRTAEIDRVVAFELGADDYVTKPFSVRELLLRLKAVLRRAGGARASERPPGKVGPI